jgi:hypothetical protein
MCDGPQDFYNVAINEELDSEEETMSPFTLEEEYVRWRTDRELRRRRRDRPFEPSTIIFYPFVLSPAVKVTVVDRWTPCLVLCMPPVSLARPV